MNRTLVLRPRGHCAVETLERRVLLSTLDGEGTLTVLGTDVRDTISVARSGDNVSTVVNGSSQSFPVTAVRRVVVSSLGGYDQITCDVDLAAGGAGIPVEVDGGALSADVTFNGTAAADTIRFASTPTGGTISLGNSTLIYTNTQGLVLDAGAGDDTLITPQPPSQTIGALNGGAGSDTIEYNGTDGNDQFTLANYFSQFNAAERVVINGGGGDDVFEISRYREASTLVLRGGDGDDTFRLGGTGTMGDFRGGAEIDAGTGRDEIVYLDQRDYGATFELTPTRFSRSGYPAPSYPDITQAGVEAVTLYTISYKADTVSVTPGADTSFSINTAVGPQFPAATTPEDTLRVERAGLVDPALTETGPGAGVYTFANRQPVTFAGVRLRPDFIPPRVASASYDVATREVRLVYSERSVLGVIGSPTPVVLHPLRDDGSEGPAVSMQFGVFGSAPNTIPLAMGDLPAGRYRLTVPPGVAVDEGEDVSTETFVWDFDAPSVVTGRHLFARDQFGGVGVYPQWPLLPGQAASFSNVTTDGSGIFRVAVDVAGLPAGREPTADDFELRAGAGGDPATWPLVDAVPAVSVRRGDGDRLWNTPTDRVFIEFPDAAVRNKWLRVSTRATGATGLAAGDEFYYGDLVGKLAYSSPQGQTPLRVTAADLLAVTRMAMRGSNDRLYDLNGDGTVDRLDVLAERSNLNHSLGVITPTPASPPPVVAAVAATRRPAFRAPRPLDLDV